MPRATWIRRCVAAGAALCLVWSAGGCKKKAPADLILVSPHNDHIEKEFERAFRAWHKQRFGADVTLEYRDVGGTTTATQFLINQYRNADSSGIDLYFGGGAPDHKLLASRGVTRPVQLPAELLAALPRTIGGVEQYDPEGHWYGTAVSCFGILYNIKLLKAYNLPVPKTWDDLAAPEMYRRIAAADAMQSGSARAAYEMIVQSAPDWASGWAKLLKILANCKHFTSGASDVVNDVANGEVLAGAAIDFYAYQQIALAGEDLGFTVVAGTTAFTPDPISLLKGAPHEQTAKRFIEFVLSPQGQALWCLPAGAADGPKRHALYRQPIRRDAYEKHKGKMLARLVNPFKESGDFELDEAAAGVRISRLHGPLMKAAATDSRDELSRAWKIIIDAGEGERARALMKEFTALPNDLADETTALETARKLSQPEEGEKIRRGWQRYFRRKYERIIAGK